MDNQKLLLFRITLLLSATATEKGLVFPFIAVFFILFIQLIFCPFLPLAQFTYYLPAISQHLKMSVSFFSVQQPQQRFEQDRLHNLHHTEQKKTGQCGI